MGVGEMRAAEAAVVSAGQARHEADGANGASGPRVAVASSRVKRRHGLVLDEWADRWNVCSDPGGMCAVIA